MPDVPAVAGRHTADVRASADPRPNVRRTPGPHGSRAETDARPSFEPGCRATPGMAPSAPQYHRNLYT
jgi:hypothetical protein